MRERDAERVRVRGTERGCRIRDEERETKEKIYIFRELWMCFYETKCIILRAKVFPNKDIVV